MEILLKNVNYIDIIRGSVKEKADILIQDGKIKQIGKEIDRVCETLDLKGKWAVPGLINLHEHQTYKRLIGPLYGKNGAYAGLTAVDITIRAVRAAVYSLKCGITTICEMGAPYGISFAMKSAIDDGVIPGPRMYVSGQSLTITGGHAHELAREVDTEEEMVKEVRVVLKSGADWVKLLCSHEPMDFETGEPVTAEMSEELIAIAVEEAHRLGKLVAVHAMGATEIQRAINAGVDAIHHGAYLTKEQAAAMKEKNIAFISTYSSYNNTSCTAFGRGKKWGEQHLVLRPALKEGFQNALEAGVLIGAGPDSVGDLFDELYFMHAFGMSSLECLRTVTINAAKILHIEEKLGSIEEGKIADLSIVNDNPLNDFENLRDPEYVLKNGEVYHTQNLSWEHLNPKWLLEKTDFELV